MQHDLLAKVVAALNSAGIAHMVTGSFASTYHGEPRMTRDIDLVIDPDTTTVSLFVEQFEPGDFYIDDAVSATARRDMFNVIDIKTGWKVDLIIRKDRAFSTTEFGRRLPAVIGGVATYIASAEDSILSKLEWSKTSDSDQQFRDVVAMIRIQRATLDFDYLKHWADELGVADELRSASAPDS